MERYIWTQHPYVAYTMCDKLINPFTLLVGPCLVSYLIYKSTIPVEAGGYHLPWWNIVLSYVVWLSATRTAKLLPHLWNRPQDIIYVPAFILFGYYFAIMKLYALCTLHETGWGTRAGIGDIAAATAAIDAGNEKAGNNPYSQPAGAFSNSQHPLSPFRDQVPLSPYRDTPGSTLSYSNRGNANRRTDEEGVELQVGYAR